MMKIKNKAVAYSLWLELFEEALKGRRAEDSLYSYGTYSLENRFYWIQQIMAQYF